MNDEPEDRKPVSRRDALPQRVEVLPRDRRADGAADDGASPTVRTWQYRYSGRATGASGFFAGALLLAAVIAALVLGAVAITVVLWIALSLVLVGAIVAIVRRLFGMGGRSRGP